MKDKKQHMKQASVGRADDAPRAADALTEDAPQLPPLSNRGVQKPKTPVYSKKPLNVTKPISWTAKETC